MTKKIKSNIPNFGIKYHSNNSEFKLHPHKLYYKFYRKNTNILHNEFGPAVEYYDGAKDHYINNQLHNLNKYASKYKSSKSFYVINKFLGNSKIQFIKNLANCLIPLNINYNN